MERHGAAYGVAACGNRGAAGPAVRLQPPKLKLKSTRGDEDTGNTGGNEPRYIGKYQRKKHKQIRDLGNEGNREVDRIDQSDNGSHPKQAY